MRYTANGNWNAFKWGTWFSYPLELFFPHFFDTPIWQTSAPSLSLDHPWPHQARCEAVNLVGQIEDFGGEGWAMGPWVDGTFWRWVFQRWQLLFSFSWNDCNYIKSLSHSHVTWSLDCSYHPCSTMKSRPVLKLKSIARGMIALAAALEDKHDEEACS